VRVERAFGLVVECGLAFSTPSRNSFILDFQSPLKVEAILPSAKYLEIQQEKKIAKGRAVRVSVIYRRCFICIEKKSSTSKEWSEIDMSFLARCRYVCVIRLWLRFEEAGGDSAIIGNEMKRVGGRGEGTREEGNHSRRIPCS
jgi:hypothetical protein